MKSTFYAIAIALLLPFYLKAQNATYAENVLDSFFANIVRAGKVNYDAIDPNELEKHIESIKSQIRKEYVSEDQKAQLINFYNLLVIKRVLHYFPIQSVQEVGGFFEEKWFTLFEKSFSLNDLEKNYIFRLFPDARLHFALNCGAKSCPELQSESYKSEQLDTQLDRVTLRFLNDANFNYYIPQENKLYVSELFRWYFNDFTKSQNSIIDFMNPYLETKVDQDAKIEYLMYDWSLNSSTSGLSNSFQPYRASQLYKKGQMEVKLFNALYTQRDQDQTQNFQIQGSYFSSFLQVLIGSQRRFNYGFDVVYKSNTANESFEYGPFAPFRFQNTSDIARKKDGEPLYWGGGEEVTTYYSHGFGHIGPKVKFSPLKKLPNLTLQQTVYFPIKKEVDGNHISFTQIFYDQLIGSNQQIFVEASSWTKIHPDFSPSFFLKGFYSYFPNNRFTIYGNYSYPFEIGGGVKYFLTPEFEIEILSTKYLPFGKYQNQKIYTLNLGFRYSNL